VAILFLGCSRYANSEDPRGHSLVNHFFVNPGLYRLSDRITITQHSDDTSGMVIIVLITYLVLSLLIVVK
jgi:hypothetical protein